MLKLMYITNRVDIAQIAEEAGVDRIFIDMEYIGKSKRQGGMNTVQNHHTYSDIEKICQKIKRAELIVRCNPIHEETSEYCSSREEIDNIVARGADMIMLPYFKTKQEAEQFIEYVNNRARVLLLVETPQAVENIDEILELEGIDEVFVGLNDLSLGYGKKFMFELLEDGTVEKLCLKFREKGIPYGFGGIAALGQGLLPSERVIKEHYRLGSTCSILSRSFYNDSNETDLDSTREFFVSGLEKIRVFEKECERYASYFWENKKEISGIITKIVGV